MPCQNNLLKKRMKYGKKFVFVYLISCCLGKNTDVLYQFSSAVKYLFIFLKLVLFSWKTTICIFIYYLTKLLSFKSKK